MFSATCKPARSRSAGPSQGAEQQDGKRDDKGGCNGEEERGAGLDGERGDEETDVAAGGKRDRRDDEREGDEVEQCSHLAGAGAERDPCGGNEAAVADACRARRARGR